MPKFIFAYHGGKMPDTPEEGEKVMAAWNKWYQDMGGKLADPGAPVGKSKTVSAGGVADNGGANPLSGWTVVTADGVDAAVRSPRAARSSPPAAASRSPPVMEM